MSAKLYSVVLDVTKEPGELKAFIDKLYRLEKIGYISSADDWLLMREARNAYSHDYPVCRVSDSVTRHNEPRNVGLRYR